MAGKNALTNFPAVMLTNSDAEHLIKITTWLNNQNIAPVFEVIVSSTPMALDTPYLGSELFPKVHVKDKIIVVYSRMKWGVVLTNAASSNQEWQLFVLNRNDLGLLTPWKMKSYQGKDMSAATYFSNNPVEAYAGFLSKKCPSGFTVDENNVLTLTKRTEFTKRKHHTM